MFNKKKCNKCKWHGALNGNGSAGVFCYYSGHHRESCLYREGKKIKDKRGNDPEHCLLFEKGRSISIAKSHFEERG